MFEARLQHGALLKKVWLVLQDAPVVAVHFVSDEK
jgi:hypothetical protein